MNQRREELPPIKFRELADALLAQVDTLVPAWLHGGHRSVNEWICGGLSGGAGRSCSVNMVTGKWADFSSDEKGNDLLGLYAAIHNLSSGKAAVQVARELGLESVAGLVKAASGATIAPVANPRPAPPPKPAPPPMPWNWPILLAIVITPDLMPRTGSDTSFLSFLAALTERLTAASIMAATISFLICIVLFKVYTLILKNSIRFKGRC